MTKGWQYRLGIVGFLGLVFAAAVGTFGKQVAFGTFIFAMSILVLYVLGILVYFIVRGLEP
jgi:hypothetical protein